MGSMGLVPFAGQQPGQNPSGDPFLSGFDFGKLPFGSNPIGGSNNGLSLSGAWASGGFGGATPTSGFNAFSGTVPFSSNSPGSFGVPGSNFPAFSAPNMTGFSGAPGTGLTGFPQIQGNVLKDIYGHGVGNALQQFLNSGAGFNPQVIQAEINQAMPLEAKATSRIMDIFGNEGAAYSSTAALGIGDFESQFNAALEGQFAQQYQNSVQNWLDVIMKVAPQAQANEAQQNNWMNIFSNVFKDVSGIVPFF